MRLSDAITLETATIHTVRVDLSELPHTVTVKSDDVVTLELFFGYQNGTGRPIARRVTLSPRDVANLANRLP